MTFLDGGELELESELEHVVEMIGSSHDDTAVTRANLRRSCPCAARAKEACEAP